MGIKIGNWRIGGKYNAITTLIIFSLAYYPITYALNELVNKYIQYGAWWDSALCTGLYFVAVFMALPRVLRTQTKTSLILLFIAVAVFLITILFGLDGAKEASNSFSSYFLTCFSFLFVGVAIQDFDELDEPINIVTRIITVAAIIWIAIVVFQINRGRRVAYMNVSYCVLPASLFRIYYYFRDRGYKNFLWMLACLLCHIIWGTRGPILFTVVFLALCIVLNNKNKKGAIAAILLVLSGIVIYHYFYEILMWVNTIFIRMGLQNGGIIKLLTEEDLLDGRGDLFSQIIPYVNQHFVFGGGIFSDRTIIGGYAHLLPLELICDFGVIPGTIVFLILLISIVKRVSALKDFCNIKWALFWIVLIVGFGKLFISGSYLEEPYFYFLVGLLSNRCMYENTISDTLE